MCIHYKIMSITLLLHTKNILIKHTPLCTNNTNSVSKLYLLVMPQTATMSCWNMVVCAKYLSSTAAGYSGLTYAIVCVGLVGIPITHHPALLQQEVGLVSVFHFPRVF